MPNNADARLRMRLRNHKELIKTEVPAGRKGGDGVAWEAFVEDDVWSATS